MGLGWALNAGGVITRVIHDRDDFTATAGYLNNTNALPTTMTATTACTSPNPTYIESALDGGTYDTEPDVFYFNFGGNVGKFMFTPGVGAAADVVNLMPYQDISIVPNTTSSAPTSWTVKTADGTTYTFAQAETSTVTTYTYLNVPEYVAGTCGANTCGEGDTDTDPATTTVSNATSAITTSVVLSWYLSSITSPSGNTVLFSYDPPVTVPPYVPTLNSYTYTASEMAFGGTNATICSNCYDKTIRRTQKVDFYPVILYNITYSPGGKIVFTNSDRCSSATDGKQLNKIEVFGDNVTTTPFKSLALAYYTCNADKRLWLKTVTELGSGETVATAQSPQYGFIYYPNTATTVATATAPTSLLTTNKGQDYWGYSNGTSNTSLIPRFVDASLNRYYDGGNRLANVTSSTYGALNRIIYPTKGSKKFDYELHDYNNTNGLTAYTTSTNTASVALNSVAPCNTATTATATATVSLSKPTLMTIANSCFTGNAYVTVKLDGTVKYVFGNPPVASGYTATCLTNNAPLTLNASTGSSCVITAFGTATEGVRFSVNFTSFTTATTANKNVGGLRIQSTKLFSNSTLVKQTDYEYKTVDTGTGIGSVGTTSSGVLRYPVSFFNSLNQAVNTASPTICAYKIRTALGTIPLYAVNHGSPVGYSQVTVYDVNATTNTKDNGKTVYTFDNATLNSPTLASVSAATINSGSLLTGGALSFPYQPVTFDYTTAGNGYLTQVNVYKGVFGSSYTNLQRTVYSYPTLSASNTAMVSGMRFRSLIGATTLCNYVSWVKYDIPAVRKQVLSIADTYFEEAGTNSTTLTTTNTYRSNVPFFLASSTQTVDGTTYQTSITYPADYTYTPTTEPLTMMKNSFMHAYPVMVKRSVAGAVLQRDITKYGNTTPGGIHPASTHRGFATSTDPPLTGALGVFFSIPSTFTDLLMSYTYDSFGNLNTYNTQAQPKPTSITYSNGLFPTLISQGAGDIKQTMAYNTVFTNQVRSITNAAGTPTTMHYNLLGQVFVTKDADNNLLNANYQNVKQ